MAGWNALFHRPEVFRADLTESELWNRPVPIWWKGLGHCGACHSPRNALGAEKQSAYLAGGFAESWGSARAQPSLSQAPIPWSGDELYAYLRTGGIRLHGVAAGPMAPVVKELAALPDQDIRAMAVYLGSFNDAAIDAPAHALAAKLEASTGTRSVATSSLSGARLYRGLRGLSRVGGAPLFGSQTVAGAEQQPAQQPARQSGQVVLHGIAKPVSSDLGYMPAFKDGLTDGQASPSWHRTSGSNLPRIGQPGPILGIVGRIRREIPR